MGVTTDDLQAVGDRLYEALSVYEQFVGGWPYDEDSLPADVEDYLATRYLSPPDTARQSGIALASVVTELYHEASETAASYVQQARNRDRQDWDRVVAETAPLREAMRAVHTAGYEPDPRGGEPGYTVPKELCPARMVSMNGASEPVVYEDRVAQYRAIATRFDLDTDVVYHPGCGHDVSPSAAFPDSEVRYVDVDEAAMTDLRGAGYRAEGADATGHELPDGADVILFRNAGLVEEAIVERNLRSGGWVIANDHLESARHLTELESLDLVGVVPDEWEGTAAPVETGGLPDSLYRDGSSLDLSVFRRRG